jgi:hypothetical protein
MNSDPKYLPMSTIKEEDIKKTSSTTTTNAKISSRSKQYQSIFSYRLK